MCGFLAYPQASLPSPALGSAAFCLLGPGSAWSRCPRPSHPGPRLLVCGDSVSRRGSRRGRADSRLRSCMCPHPGDWEEAHRGDKVRRGPGSHPDRTQHSQKALPKASHPYSQLELKNGKKEKPNHMEAAFRWPSGCAFFSGPGRRLPSPGVDSQLWQDPDAWAERGCA